MPSQKFKMYYIDDQIDGSNNDERSRRIRDLINAEGEFECELIPPPKDFAVLPTWQVDALLVDLDLSTVGPDGEKVSYFGNTLAAEMRVRQPNCPIILTTGQAKERWRLQVLDNGDADLIWFKDAIIAEPDKFKSEIRNLVLGFKRLTGEHNRTFEGLMEILGAKDDDEKRLLRESGLPLLRRSKENVEATRATEWLVPNVARWLRTVVLEYPGVMYDAPTAAARLGISQESFELPEVQTLFKPALYSGPLSDAHPHWWRDRLLLSANGLMLDAGMHGALADVFGGAFEKVENAQRTEKTKNVLLTPSLCVFDGKPGASWVCHVLGAPVKIANSLAYFPDARPVVMEQARVSFKAIKGDPRFDDALVDPQDRAFVEQLWNQDQ